jgi:hypothetical protein
MNWPTRAGFSKVQAMPYCETLSFRGRSSNFGVAGGSSLV